MNGTPQLFCDLHSYIPQYINWKDTQCTLSVKPDGYVFHVAGNSSNIELTDRELTWLKSHGLNPHDQECSREKVASLGILLGTDFNVFNISEIETTAARKSLPYLGTNLVFGAPFEPAFREALAAITTDLKARMKQYDLADSIVSHHPEGLHASLTIFWEQNPVKVNEEALQKWSQEQPPVTLTIKPTPALTTPFFISSSGLIIVLAQSANNAIQTLREQVGSSCEVTDKNRGKSVSHIILGYLLPDHAWNSKKVIDEITSFCLETNLALNLSCEMTQANLVTYNKQTLEPNARIRAIPLPLKGIP